MEKARQYRVDPQFIPTGINCVDVDENSKANGMAVDLDAAIIDTGVDTDHPDLINGGGIDFSANPR